MTANARTFIVSPWRSITEAAQELGYSTKTIRRAIRSGELPAYRLRRNGPWRIHVDDLAEIMRKAA